MKEKRNFVTDCLWWKKATAWLLTAAMTCSLPGTPVFGSPEKIRADVEWESASGAQKESEDG